MHKFFANSLFIGKKLEILPHCHSTNQVAGEILVKEKPHEGTIILTENQQAGKGQRGASWESNPGENLTFSIILYPSFLLIKHQFYLNIIVSLAVAGALRKHIGHGIKVKWPNDIYVGDKKICGILIENGLRGTQIEHTVVGIGLNVNQLEFKSEKATSLSEMTLEQYDLNVVFNEVIQNVEKHYLLLKSGQLERIKSLYLDNLYWINETHLFDANGVFSGQIVDVNESGKLIVESNHVKHSYDIKEIAFVE